MRTDSLLQNLSQYMRVDDRLPEENFLTEALCFLLRRSVAQGTLLFARFMDLFSYEITAGQYDGYEIHTQCAYRTSDGRMAVPDISISKTGISNLFIEVKVEAGLNYYDTAEKEIIDQLENYRRIRSAIPSTVCLLSKYKYEETDERTVARRWNEVHSLLHGYHPQDEIENFLVGELIAYLEERNMSTPRVTYELMKGMESLCSLCDQLEQVLEAYDYQKSFGYEWLGYHVFDKHRNRVAWVGNYYEGERIVASVQGQPQEFAEQLLAKYPKEFDEKGEDGRFWVHSWFNFEERGYFCLPAEKQIEVLSKWLCGKLDLILGMTK